MTTPYGSTPTPEGALMLLAIERPYGIEVSVADPKSSLARFYTARSNMKMPTLDDLQFRQIGPHDIWIMRKERRAEIKSQGEQA